MPLHRDASDPAQLHRPNITQEADPGAVGAHKTWLTPSTGILRRRTSGNDGWDVVARDPTVSAETTAAYTISISDWGAHVRLSDATEVVVTVPEDASDDLPVGMTVWIEQADDGPVVIEPETSSPVIHSLTDADTTAGAAAVVVLRKVAADKWIIWGDLMATES